MHAGPGGKDDGGPGCAWMMVLIVEELLPKV